MDKVYTTLTKHVTAMFVLQQFSRLMVLVYIVAYIVILSMQRFFSLHNRVVQEEAQRSQQLSQDRKSPNRTNGCNENRSIDILEMLSKAKVEYERVREVFV